MTNNNQVILNTIIEDKHKDTSQELTKDDFFELFSAEQILKNYDLSYDEIESGLVDGGDDGGIDGFFTFVNGELLREDFERDKLPRRDAQINLYIIQSKNQKSFKEKPIQLLKDSVCEILNLDINNSELGSRYNEGVRRQSRIFRRAFKELIPSFPSLRISIQYASKGIDVHPKVHRRSQDLCAELERLFSDTEITFDFVGVNELIKLVRQEPKKSFQLKLAENPISSSNSVAYVCLASIKNFYNFIVDEEGNLIKQI